MEISPPNVTVNDLPVEVSKNSDGNTGRNQYLCQFLDSAHDFRLLRHHQKTPIGSCVSSLAGSSQRTKEIHAEHKTLLDLSQVQMYHFLDALLQSRDPELHQIQRNLYGCDKS
jgi:hypothetical protein